MSNLYKEINIRPINGMVDMFKHIKFNLIEIYRDLAFVTHYILGVEDKQMPAIIDISLAPIMPKEITNIIGIYTLKHFDYNTNNIRVMEVEKYLKSKYSKKIEIDLENMFFKQLFNRHYIYINDFKKFLINLDNILE